MDNKTASELLDLVRDYVDKRASELGRPLNQLTLDSSNEVYVFIYDDASRAEASPLFGRFAKNPDLGSFTWFDAAVLKQKVDQDLGPEFLMPPVYGFR